MRQRPQVSKSFIADRAAERFSRPVSSAVDLQISFTVKGFATNRAERRSPATDPPGSIGVLGFNPRIRAEVRTRVSIWFWVTSGLKFHYNIVFALHRNRSQHKLLLLLFNVERLWLLLVVVLVLLLRWNLLFALQQLLNISRRL